MRREDTVLNAIIGAVVTVLLTVVPLSPLFGGGVAGYLQRETPIRGAKVGALSGAIALIPLVVVAMAVFSIVSVGVELAIPGAGVLLLVIGLVLLTFVAVYTIGLGAVGGYLGSFAAGEYHVGRRQDERYPSDGEYAPPNRRERDERGGWSGQAGAGERNRPSEHHDAPVGPEHGDDSRDDGADRQKRR